jgi:hypothetical protein
MQFAQAADRLTASRSSGGKQHVGAPAKPAYQSKTFRCLGDFEKCCKSHSSTLCASLCIICIAQQLVPFT